MTIEALEEIRSFAGAARTTGLPDDVIERFRENDPALRRAIDEARVRHRALRDEFPEVLALEEGAQIAKIQERFVNFYAQASVNPYVALAARGPWIVTVKGAVLHDSGGYGMLGLGHAPDTVIDAMCRPHVMANVMTANHSQLRLARALMREIGHTRKGGCPFDRFICLNSGSESVTLAARISDINAKRQTDPGGRHAGKAIKVVALKGGFHGRTQRPAQLSDSTYRDYQAHLASFRALNNLITVRPNDVADLRAAFARADREGSFIEAAFFEPVMGEGNPGQAIEREFYDAARELTRARGSLLVADSIQAGLRAHGCLSIVDYPGFQDAEPPDMETYSKALNAGQYPLSVVAMNDCCAELYQTGVYGNTMTTNPRAMDVACAVLDSITPELRENVRRRGAEFRSKLEQLSTELDGTITGVQGTGLLLSCALDPDLKCHGAGSIEEYLRIHGIGVIHGGKNSLRFTPHFAITSEEIELIVDATREALTRGAVTARSR
jgi:acetylornithine/succinyldiaminopimelate/putrescine aminotransferase